jgi:hypothetical protein|tara:strand:+ start:432 stop:755 length:324 start_codon:yes stop_codon:yes gene_type:complete
MDFNTGRPNHIEDYLAQLHSGQWFGWTNSKNKIYANLKLSEKVGIEGNIVDNLITELPTEQECIDGLATIQADFDTAKTQKATDKASAVSKLEALGLSSAEIDSLTK